MTTTSHPPSAPLASMMRLLTGCISLATTAAQYLAPLFLRFGLAVPFFKSGLTRWDGFPNIADATIYLFTEEFKLHIFTAEFPIPFPFLTAHIVSVAEILLPILLVLGLGTRLAAIGLLAMTAVIEMVVPDGWANFHLPWAAMAMALIAMGPGPLSFDYFFGRMMNRNAANHT